jgi:hypothetical protein
MHQVVGRGRLPPTGITLMIPIHDRHADHRCLVEFHRLRANARVGEGAIGAHVEGGVRSWGWRCGAGICRDCWLHRGPTGSDPRGGSDPVAHHSAFTRGTVLRDVRSIRLRTPAITTADARERFPKDPYESLRLRSFARSATRWMPSRRSAHSFGTLFQGPSTEYN